MGVLLGGGYDKVIDVRKDGESAEYYYDNPDPDGSEEGVSSKINFYLGRKKDARNMTIEVLVSWAKEEANSPCFHTPQRHLVDKGVDYDVSVMEVVDDNILVSNDNVGATEVVDDNILVSNDNVGTKEEVCEESQFTISGEYYYDNPDPDGSGEGVSSKINFYLGRKKYARNMTLEVLVSWAKEEANSPCFHTPQRHLGGQGSSKYE
nr:hypothetical protein [Tanacetum cinerariifolium]